jgi:hypothetical protein
MLYSYLSHEIFLNIIYIILNGFIKLHISIDLNNSWDHLFNVK